MDRLLQAALSRLIRKGTLHITTAAGSIFTVGDRTGKPIAIRFTTLAAQLSVLRDADLKLGEAYVDGTLVIEQGSIFDLLALTLLQDRAGRLPHWMQPLWVARYLRRWLQQRNGRNRARRNAAHHYDLDGRLYSLFL